MGRKPNNTGATSLAQIQQSSQPVSAEQAYKDEQEQGYSNVALSEAKEQTSEWVIFKLVNTKKKGRVYIDCINDAWNPDSKKVERMRLLSANIILLCNSIIFSRIWFAASFATFCNIFSLFSKKYLSAII